MPIEFSNNDTKAEFLSCSRVIAQLELSPGYLEPAVVELRFKANLAQPPNQNAVMAMLLRGNERMVTDVSTVYPPRQDASTFWHRIITWGVDDQGADRVLHLEVEATDQGATETWTERLVIQRPSGTKGDFTFEVKARGKVLRTSRAL